MIFKSSSLIISEGYPKHTDTISILSSIYLKETFVYNYSVLFDISSIKYIFISQFLFSIKIYQSSMVFVSENE